LTKRHFTKYILLTKDIDIKLGLYLITAFIFFTAIGTLSHEFGHFIAARLLQHDASFNYGFTFYGDSVSYRDSFIITLCGPLQTITTGTIGFLLLLSNKNNFYSSNKLNFRHWLFIFISLFWLREMFNFVQSIIIYFLKGHFPDGNDEVRLADALDINTLSFTLPAAIIATFILTYIVFKFIPIKQRFTFLISGLIGGLFGFYLWLYLIGPIVMP